MRILITGSKGQLGKAAVQILQADHYLYAWDVEDLDFNYGVKTFDKIIELNPDLILHCGAYTDVSGCELNPEKAFQVNSLGTRNIAIAAANCDATMVFVSTDYVFDGRKEKEYLEFDRTNPLNVYGRAKLAGEELVKSLLQKYYIIRTSWLFSNSGKNFVKTILRLAREKEELVVVHDQIGTPTFAKDLAQAIKVIISKPFYGTYHVANKGFCSWYEFAREIIRLTDVDIYVKPINSAEYGDIVHRPKYSVLRNFNLEMTYGYQMRDWRIALEECLQEMV